MKATIITAIEKTLKQTSTTPTSSLKLPAGKDFHYYLSKHPTKNSFQSEIDYKLFKREFDQIKKEFQQKLSSRLHPQAQIEHQLFMDTKDRTDIWVDMGKYEVIIEIDAVRADQVGKKMLSRYSYVFRLNSINKPVVYVSLLYQGTKSMNPKECIKYFQMGHELLMKINKNNVFIGYIIDAPNDYKFVPYNLMGYKAKDSKYYKRYLKNNRINSIDSYMRPLTRVHSLSLSPHDVQIILSKYISLKNTNIEVFLKKNKIIDNTTHLSKNDKTYWRRYCEYLGWQKKNGNPLGI